MNVRLAILAAAAIPAVAAEKSVPPGAELYQKMCAECHGKVGEGVKDKYDDPLFGDRSLESLAKLIDRTMPDGEPEKTSPEDSRLIAAYIYEAFYSPAAQARVSPPKYELARLTNRQYRESVADLVGSFRKPTPPADGKGLRGEYFQSDGMNKKKKRAIERMDRAVDFDFGENSPGEGISADQFSIAWNGSLQVSRTGFYEFKVITPNGVRLYLNTDLREGDSNSRDDSDGRRAPTVIDGWVSSGEKRELTTKMFLLGGRTYPLKVDYFKYKEKLGSIRLEWKPPGGTWGLLTAPALSSTPAGRVTIVDTAFPADDGSMGFERGTSVSKEWYDATMKATMDVTADVAGHINAFAQTRKDDPDRAKKIKDFATLFAARAFRRPLDQEAQELYVDRHFSGDAAPEVAVKRAVLAVLTSPRFLYPELAESDDHGIAARLALNMWDSLPDAALADAAAKGELRTPEQVRAHADRMAQDPRTRAKLASFFQHWLGEDHTDDVTKDAKLYPGFDASIVADLRESLDRFVDYVVWSERSDYRDLLLADYLFVNDRIAKYYGMTPPSSPNEFAKLEFDPSQRAGIFTHPFLLSAFSYHRSSSPIHRGVFLTRNIMGRILKQPTIAVEFKDEPLAPGLTMREKVTELTKKEVCMGCHAMINPLGFSLENFDAVGRYRTKENNAPVNAVSEYHTAEGEVIKLSGARDLAQYTATSESARRGFIRHLFHYAIKQTPPAFGADTLDRLDKDFTGSGYHIRKLFADIAVTAALNNHKAAKANKTASR